MTTLYVVHGTIGGYAREDALQSSIQGVYDNKVTAKRVASLTHSTVSEVEFNRVSPTIKAMAKEIFGIEM